MRVGLFIPCYVDQFYPHVGMATVRVLRRFGVTDLDFPEGQTCCGQPMANTGCTDAAAPLAKRFLDVFGDYDYVVGPSGSCVAMVRQHYGDLLGDRTRVEAVARKTYELCEFLTDVLGVETVPGSFPHRVGLHNGCHGLRELRLGSDSERVGPRFNKPRRLLEGLDGITLSELSRPDECCGFGGTFAVGEEAVSCLMGLDRLADHVQAGTEVLTAADMSCLMHLEGLIRRQGLPIRVMHIAEILDAATAEPKAAAVRQKEVVGGSL
ncbi:MAG TPA: (Fe-S)-binding protein [Planctomycetaceae bacterium]